MSQQQLKWQQSKRIAGDSSSQTCALFNTPAQHSAAEVSATNSAFGASKRIQVPFIHTMVA